MRRVLLAGVSLTVTACGMSAPTPVAQRPAQPTPYVLALAETPQQQCTLWREVAGQRECLDGPTAQQAKLVAPAPAAAPRLSVTSQALAAPQPAAPAAPAATAAPAPESALTGSNLFDEMRKIGMIKQPAAPIADAPASTTTTNVAEAAPTAGLPRLPNMGAPAAAAPQATTAPVATTADLPDLPKAAPGVVAAAVPASGTSLRAFADQSPAPTPAASRGTAPKVTSVVSQSWAPVEPPKAEPARVQVAASTPGVQEIMGRAPVSPVEKAELPAVRSGTVVPLKISQKATDESPAVVVPATGGAPLAKAQVAQASSTPALPSLPALPPLPTASTIPSQPVMASPAPVTAMPVPPPAPSKPAASTVTSAPALPLIPAAPPVASVPAPKPVPAYTPAPVAPRPAAPLARATPAQPERVIKVAATKAAPAKSVAAKPSSGRYLVLQSFQEREHADRLASRHRGLDAKVASATVKGQTWYRVVVRDGAAERQRLASEGIRGYWPTTL